MTVIKPTKDDLVRYAGELGQEENDCDGSSGCYGRALGVLKHFHCEHGQPLHSILKRVTTACPHAREAVIDYAAAFLSTGRA